MEQNGQSTGFYKIKEELLKSQMQGNLFKRISQEKIPLDAGEDAQKYSIDTDRESKLANEDRNPASTNITPSARYSGHLANGSTLYCDEDGTTTRSPLP